MLFEKSFLFLKAASRVASIAIDRRPYLNVGSVNRRMPIRARVLLGYRSAFIVAGIGPNSMIVLRPPGVQISCRSSLEFGSDVPPW